MGINDFPGKIIYDDWQKKKNVHQKINWDSLRNKFIIPYKH